MTHGSIPDRTDPDWLAWQKTYIDFYTATQKRGIGTRVNDAGYRVLEQLSLGGLDVLEIGPGALPHRRFWRGLPASFAAVDIDPRFLEITAERVDCPYRPITVGPEQVSLPLADSSIDLILSFYSLEHLQPLDAYLEEYVRVLRPGGRIAGAVPNEGGLAWGLGRYLTSRRWIHRHTNINYDKIICWEHPNFVDTILDGLDTRLQRVCRSAWPSVGIATRNFSLVTRFVSRKTDDNSHDN